jgi:hypothetical protein
VERGDTHRVTTHAKQADGFRERSTHPTGCADIVGERGSGVGEQKVGWVERRRHPSPHHAHEARRRVSQAFNLSSG